MARGAGRGARGARGAGAHRGAADARARAGAQATPLRHVRANLSAFNARRKLHAAALAAVWSARGGLKRHLHAALPPGALSQEELDRIRQCVRGGGVQRACVRDDA